MMEVKRVGVLSFAKIQGLYMLIFGLLAAIPFAVIGSIAGANSKSGGIFAGLGMFAFLILPIIYGVFGFIFGIISAFFYNIVAKIVGGITIEVVGAQPVQQPAQPVQQ